MNSSVFSRLRNCPTVRATATSNPMVDWCWWTSNCKTSRAEAHSNGPPDDQITFGLRNADFDVLRQPVVEQSLTTDTMVLTGAGIWRRNDRAYSQFVDARATSGDRHVELVWCCRTSVSSRRGAQRRSVSIGTVGALFSLKLFDRLNGLIRFPCW